MISIIRPKHVTLVCKSLYSNCTLCGVVYLFCAKTDKRMLFQGEDIT